MSSNDKDITEMPSRLDKTLSWLKVSRNSWKEKTKESKKQLKIATLGMKRAKESRNAIEKELQDRQARLDQKDAEIAVLKKKLEQATYEVETLKKEIAPYAGKRQINPSYA